MPLWSPEKRIYFTSVQQAYWASTHVCLVAFCPSRIADCVDTVEEHQKSIEQAKEFERIVGESIFGKTW